MLTDNGGALAIALVALRLGKRLGRCEAHVRICAHSKFLAAALNAAILIIVAVYIFAFRAVARLRDPDVIEDRADDGARLGRRWSSI